MTFNKMCITKGTLTKLKVIRGQVLNCTLNDKCLNVIMPPKCKQVCSGGQILMPVEVLKTLSMENPNGRGSVYKTMYICTSDLTGTSSKVPKEAIYPGVMPLVSPDLLRRSAFPFRPRTKSWDPKEDRMKEHKPKGPTMPSVDKNQRTLGTPLAMAKTDETSNKWRNDNVDAGINPNKSLSDTLDRPRNKGDQTAKTKSDERAQQHRQQQGQPSRSTSSKPPIITFSDDVTIANAAAAAVTKNTVKINETGKPHAVAQRPIQPKAVLRASQRTSLDPGEDEPNELLKSLLRKNIDSG